MKKNTIITIVVISILICTFYAFYDFTNNFLMTSYYTTTYINEEKEIENNKENKEEEKITNNIFQAYEDKAFQKLQELTLDEKIAQTLIVCNNNDLLTKQLTYNFGGVIFFEKDFKYKKRDQVIEMIQKLQNNSKIPLLTAIDEEGGKVSRISSNSNLVSSPFKSSQELYKENGFNAIKEDVLYKSYILENLGLNLNLAPVVDISTNEDDYMYERSIGLDASLTSIYAKTVIEASKTAKVSYALKHFPGYGNNVDTHKGIAIDNRTYEELVNNDLLPFIEGIKAGAEAILVSHNIVSCIDNEYPATLSKNIHNLLRNDLQFTGVIITDDLSMDALDNYENPEVLALNAGNDLLITSNYEKSFNNIKLGLENNLLNEELLDEIVLRILSWKYYKNLL